MKNTSSYALSIALEKKNIPRNKTRKKKFIPKTLSGKKLFILITLNYNYPMIITLSYVKQIVTHEKNNLRFQGTTAPYH